MSQAAADPALEAASWNLEPLLDGRSGDELLDDAGERAQAFAESHRGTLAGLDAAGLAAAMHELEEIYDRVGRAGSYSSLSFSLDTEDPARGALMQRTHERSTAIETALLFFELEWNELPDERAEELLGSGERVFCRHYLRTLRRYRPHQLSEPEERILTETNVTGPSAFRRLFTEQTSSVRVDLPDSEEPVPFMEALALLQDPARERRARAGESVTEALRPGLRTRGFVFNTLL